MGLTDGVYFSSWLIEFLITNFIFSLFNTIIVAGAVFKMISFGWVFLLFFLYGLNVFSLAYFFQSFMDRSRLALIFGILVYFIMYFISIVSVSAEVGNSLKLAASLLPPTALQLGVKIFYFFEVNYL